MSCCQPNGDDSTPTGRRNGVLALVVFFVLGWAALAAILITQL